MFCNKMTSRILMIRKKWEDSVNFHDLNGVMRCYDTKAIFKGTMNTQFTVKHDDIRAYFENIFAKNVSVKFIGTPKIQRFGQVFIDYGDYEFCVDGKTVKAKYSVVYTNPENPCIVSHVSYKSM